MSRFIFALIASLSFISPAFASDGKPAQEPQNFEIVSKNPRSLESIKAQEAKEAASLLTKAEAGDAQAQMQLGRRYFSGTGVKQDYAESAKWMRRSAEQGNVEAAWALAALYTHGVYGVKKDYAEAYFMYRIGMIATNGYVSSAMERHANEIANHLSAEETAAANQRVAEWSKAHPVIAKPKWAPNP